MKSNTDTITALNERITNRIIRSIEKGDTGNWTPPWADGIDVWSPINPITGKRYTAGNRFYLGMIAWMQGYGQHWATYTQWASLSRHTPKCVEEQGNRPKRAKCEQHGCELVSVRKGEKGTHALRPMIVTDKATGEQIVKGFRAYSVFAAQQVEGYTEPLPTLVEHTTDMAESIAEADEYARIVGARLEHSPTMGAAYSPVLDQITMPDHDRWTQPDRYWAILVHEMVHWTGHPDRLARDLAHPFGSEGYAKEELVAELGATFHLSHLGRANVWREDHVTYLEHWLKILRADPTALWSAAKDAERASKYLGAQFQINLAKQEEAVTNG